MDKKFLGLSLIAVALSFVGGFLLANTFNRSEIAELRSKVENAKSAASTNSSTGNETTLSPEEVRSRIAEADQNPDNFNFQKNLGLSLYRYAALKKDTELLMDAARLLERAVKLRPKDRDSAVALGNAYFDIGYIKNDMASFEAARVHYESALREMPRDVDVITDLALTYYLQSPPDNDRAAEGLQRAVNIDPEHERSLQFLIQTRLRQNRAAEAAKLLEDLRRINPANETLTALAAEIARTEDSVPR